MRRHADEALAPGEMLLRYRLRRYRVNLGAKAYFFQEGEAARYQPARFGELRVSPGGDAVLVGLCDATGQRL